MRLSLYYFFPACICMSSVYICFYYLRRCAEEKTLIYYKYSHSEKTSLDKESRTFKNQSLELTTEKTCFENRVLTTVRSEHTRSEENFTSLIEAIQNERKYTLSKACQYSGRYGKTIAMYRDFFKLNIFYSRRYKVSVCHIKKCGFSSWVRSFSVMQNIYPNLNSTYEAIKNGSTHIMDISWKFSLGADQETSKNNWQQSFKIMLVRNPFSRIVSAYYDKLVPRKGLSDYYQNQARQVRDKYKYLRHNPSDRLETGEWPIFEDFVNFLLSEATYDGHWQLFDNLCHPCLLNYDYIAKFDTMSQDMIYLRKKWKLSDGHAKALFPSNKPFKTDTAKVQREFAKIPKELSNRLYEKYRIDFELFGYERPAFL